MNRTQIVLLLLPVIVIELGLLVVALRDLLRRLVLTGAPKRHAPGPAS